jgi:hypothetical protein
MPRAPHSPTVPGSLGISKTRTARMPVPIVSLNAKVSRDGWQVFSEILLDPIALPQHITAAVQKPFRVPCPRGVREQGCSVVGRFFTCVRE